MTKAEQSAVIALFEKGWNNRMIEDKLRISHDAVQRLRKKLGYPSSKTKRGWGERQGVTKSPTTYVKKDAKPVIAPRGSLSARESMYPAFDGNQKCVTCVYRITVYPNTACGHILATGRQRGCKAGKECTKYLRGNPEDIEWKVL